LKYWTFYCCCVCISVHVDQCICSSSSTTSRRHIFFIMYHTAVCNTYNIGKYSFLWKLWCCSKCYKQTRLNWLAAYCLWLELQMASCLCTFLSLFLSCGRLFSMVCHSLSCRLWPGSHHASYTVWVWRVWKATAVSLSVCTFSCLTTSCADVFSQLCPCHDTVTAILCLAVFEAFYLPDSIKTLSRSCRVESAVCTLYTDWKLCSGRGHVAPVPPSDYSHLKCYRIVLSTLTYLFMIL